MATFSDYLRNQGSSAGPSAPRKVFSPQQTAPAAPNYDFSWMPKAGQSVEEPEPQSPLNWAMDIISRPLFAATSTVTGVSEAAARIKEGRSPLEVLGAIGENNALVGLFSTDKDQKRTYSDVMEEQTDRHGKLDDPNYVDIEDNIDPVVKGIAGFGLDVVADPLTWIPGGIIAKGAKGVIGAGKTALETGEKVAASTLKKGSKVSKEAEKLGEQAVKIADEAPTPRVVDDTDNPFSTPSTDTPAPSAVAAPKTASTVDEAVPTPSVPTVTEPAASVAVKAAEQVDPHVQFLDTFRKAPNSETLRDMLQGVQKAVGSSQTLAKVTKAVDDGSPIPAPEMAKFVHSAGEIPESDAYYALSQPLQEALVSARGTGSPVSYQRLMSVASKTSDVDDAVRQEARTFLRTSYFEKNLSKAESEVRVLEDARAAYEFVRQNETDRFEKVLGTGLVETLSKKSPKALSDSVTKIVEVLDPAASDDVIRRFYEGRNMKQLGGALNEALDLPPYVKPTANTVEEVAAVRTRLPELQSDADIAVVKTLRVDVTDAKQTYPVKEGNVRFTELDKQARIGRHVRQLNTQHQYTLWRNLDEAIKKRMSAVKGVPAEQLAGARRAQAYRQAFYDAGDSAAETYSALGLKLHLGTGHAEDLLPMNLFEAYRIVEPSSLSR